LIRILGFFALSAIPVLATAATAGGLSGSLEIVLGTIRFS